MTRVSRLFGGIAVSISIALTGCGTAPDNAQFTGPYAAEFRQAYERATTDQIKAVFADGVITAEELAEAKQGYIACMEGAGYTVLLMDDDGSRGFKPPTPDTSSDEVEKQMAACDAITGWGDIAWLWTQVRINPDRLDTATIMAACLVRVGLRQDGYSAVDYRAEMEMDPSPLSYEYGSYESNLFYACDSDPLNATAQDAVPPMPIPSALLPTSGAPASSASAAVASWPDGIIAVLVTLGYSAPSPTVDENGTPTITVQCAPGSAKSNTVTVWKDNGARTNADTTNPANRRTDMAYSISYVVQDGGQSIVGAGYTNGPDLVDTPNRLFYCN
jgi:hypothetical protein